MFGKVVASGGATYVYFLTRKVIEKENSCRRKTVGISLVIVGITFKILLDLYGGAIYTKFLLRKLAIFLPQKWNSSLKPIIPNFCMGG